MTGTVLIAGAGPSGSRCAETLRARGWEGRVLLVGDEPHAPYERPALSKQLLAGERHDIALRPDPFWAEQRIELVLGRSVEKIDIWGRRRLSFEIAKKTEGIYAVVDLQAEPATVKELDRQLNLNEVVLRTKVIRPDMR